MNMNEWINHYLWMGVEHFYMIDNGSTDDSVEIMKKFGDKITIVNLPEPYQQGKHYQDTFNNYINGNTTWLIISDMDEFWYCLNSTIATQLGNLPSSINYIKSHWRMFGSEGLQNHPPDIRTAIVHRKAELDKDTKYIFKLAELASPQSPQSTPHKIQLHELGDENNMNLYNDTNSIFRLNHYPIQSWEFFSKIKMTRGDATTILPSNNSRDENYFTRYDANTDFLDEDLKNMVMVVTNQKDEMAVEYENKEHKDGFSMRDDSYQYFYSLSSFSLVFSSSIIILIILLLVCKKKNVALFIKQFKKF